MANSTGALSVGNSVPSADEKAVLDKLLEMYMPSVEESIFLRAEAIAAPNRPGAKDFMLAIQEYIPGVPAVITKQRWSWINQNVTGFMAITAFMTLIFGILGIVPQVKVEGFLEIAKIFAGALVGGAAGAAAGSRRP